MPKLDQYTYDAIVGYMDEDIRERVHNYMAPCSNEEFLIEYCAQDRSFEELLKAEFHIDMWDYPAFVNRICNQ